MARLLKLEFLKLEFKDLYEELIQLMKLINDETKNKENYLKTKAIISNKCIKVVHEINFQIYKKNKILYNQELDNKSNLLTLYKINLIPEDVLNKIIKFIEQTDKHYKIKTTTEEEYNINLYFDDINYGLYDILVWLVINCGEENYKLILDGLAAEEKHIFNKYINKSNEMKKTIDDESDISKEELKEKISKLVEQGENYYFGRNVSKNYKEAIKYFLRAAKYGDEYGETYMGLFYERGFAVKRDYNIASKWYAKAATKGNSFAQYSLGVLLLNGNGIKKDYNKAFLWLQKSSESEYVPSYYQLGRIYYNGYGVEKNLDTALKWYRKAAEQNFSAAQHALAFMYKNGEGCEKNNVKAYYWLEKAAENEYEDAYYVVGKSYLEGIVYEVDYEKAYYYLNKGYKELDTNCIEALADMYYKGLYVEKDVMKALELYNKSIDEDSNNLYFKVGKIYEEEGLIKQAISYYNKGHEALDIRCTQRLGIIYYNGEGVSRDIEKSIGYMEIAAKEKAPHAMYVLGVAYLRLNKFGENTEEIAEKLFREAYKLKSAYAAEYLAYLLINRKREGKKINEGELLEYIDYGIKNNIADSYFQYGYIYNKGIAVEKDLEKAYKYYSIAAEKKSIKAMMKLAEWYKRGKFVAKDIELSIRWYEEAANLKEVEAIENLIEIYELGIGGSKSEVRALYYVFKLIELDALKGKSKLAYYCYSGVGVERDTDKGKDIVNEINQIDKGTANNIECYLAQQKLIKMTECEIVQKYIEGIELGNLECYGDLALYLYRNNLYEKEKYKESFKIAMEGVELNVKKCNYVYLMQKLKEKTENTIVTVEEIFIIKQIQKLIDGGFYYAINDLLYWYESRKKEFEENYYKLKEEALFYNINNKSYKKSNPMALILSLFS